MIEGVPIKLPEQAILIGCDSGSTWCVIEQGKFTKSFTWLVSLEESRICLSREDLGAGKRS